MPIIRVAAFLCSAFLLSSCVTNFVGSAYVEQGPAGCKKKCTDWGLEFAGMIAMGEYSDGCICRKPAAKADVSLESAAGEAAVAGVVAERNRQQQQQQRMMMSPGRGF